MLGDRLKQFREYNNLDIDLLAKMLKITPEEYEDFEKGRKEPNIDIITRLATYYKTTVREFYGNNPRITLHSKDAERRLDDDSVVDERILKMADLSWEEAQLILYYREKGSDDELMSQIIKELYDNE